MSMSTDADLEAAENAVCDIIKVTGETMKELESLPSCDPEKLKMLAKEFMAHLGTVRSKLSGHSSLAQEEESPAAEEKFHEDFSRKTGEIQELIKALEGQRANDSSALYASSR